MNVLPFQFLLVLRLTLLSLAAQGEHTQRIHVVGDIKDAADDGISRSAVGQSATAHLNPTGAVAELLSLVLHGDGSDGAILHPTVVLHGVAQYHDGQGCAQASRWRQGRRLR